MPIIIMDGDIFEANAQALVVPANVQPDLKWGSHIAERLEKMVEPRIKEERKAFGDVALGKACLTLGTGSPFSYLIYASILNKYDFNPLFLLRLRQRTSDETLKRALYNTKAIAHTHHLKRVALSAMGAGIGAMPYATCCHISFQALIDSPTTWLFYAYKPKEFAIAQEILEGVIDGNSD